MDADGGGSADELLKKAGEMLLDHADEPAVQDDVVRVLQSNDARITCPVECRPVQSVEDGLALENWQTLADRQLQEGVPCHTVGAGWVAVQE